MTIATTVAEVIYSITENNISLQAAKRGRARTFSGVRTRRFGEIEGFWL